jgi:hypothetical protein
MFRTAALSTIFLSCAAFAGTSFGEAQPLEPSAPRPILNEWRDVVEPRLGIHRPRRLS